MANPQALIPATLASAFVFGMVPTLLTRARLPWARHLGITEQRAQALTVAGALALVPMMLVGGVALDKWGPTGGIVVGSVLLALGLAALAVSRTVGQALAPVLLIGGGGACLGIGSCILMPMALFPGNPLAAANFGTLGFALGALLTGSLVDKMIDRWGVQKALLGLALTALLPGVILTCTPWSEPHQAPAGLGQSLGGPLLWLTTVAVLLYSPLEARLAAWSTRYLTAMGHRPNLAVVLTTGFWLSFLASRLVAGFLTAPELLLKYPEPWIVFTLALGIAIVLGNVAGTLTPRSAGVGMILVGAGLGPIFPTLLGLVLAQLPQAPGSACGVLFAAATLGGLVLPALRGEVGQSADASKALRYQMLLALALGGVALAIALVLASLEA
jgi:fucose permease